ncbi:uncharacterized protein LOC143683255 [Tamandua tetradactyla]|uniref:uncharacterized protein LOC143683255 n=1 Tax=Tamandua tetradactyla TaxID=48850 RepID=UPI004053E498
MLPFLLIPGFRTKRRPPRSGSPSTCAGPGRPEPLETQGNADLESPAHSVAFERRRAQGPEDRGSWVLGRCLQTGRARRPQSPGGRVAESCLLTHVLFRYPQGARRALKIVRCAPFPPGCPYPDPILAPARPGPAAVFTGSSDGAARLARPPCPPTTSGAPPRPAPSRPPGFSEQRSPTAAVRQAMALGSLNTEEKMGGGWGVEGIRNPPSKLVPCGSGIEAASKYVPSPSRKRSAERSPGSEGRQGERPGRAWLGPGTVRPQQARRDRRELNPGEPGNVAESAVRAGHDSATFVFIAALYGVSVAARVGRRREQAQAAGAEGIPGHRHGGLTNSRRRCCGSCPAVQPIRTAQGFPAASPLAGHTAGILPATCRGSLSVGTAVLGRSGGAPASSEFVH